MCKGCAEMGRLSTGTSGYGSINNKTEEDCEKECIAIIKEHIWVTKDDEVFYGYSGYGGAGYVFSHELDNKETIDMVTREAKKRGWKKAYELGKKASKYYANRFKRYFKAVD